MYGLETATNGACETGDLPRWPQELQWNDEKGSATT